MAPSPRGSRSTSATGAYGQSYSGQPLRDRGGRFQRRRRRWQPQHERHGRLRPDSGQRLRSRGNRPLRRRRQRRPQHECHGALRPILLRPAVWDCGNRPLWHRRAVATAACQRHGLRRQSYSGQRYGTAATATVYDGQSYSAQRDGTAATGMAAYGAYGATAAGANPYAVASCSTPAILPPAYGGQPYAPPGYGGQPYAPPAYGSPSPSLDRAAYLRARVSGL